MRQHRIPRLHPVDRNVASRYIVHINCFGRQYMILRIKLGTPGQSYDTDLIILRNI